MYIATVGGKVTFLLGQILAVAGDDSLTVQHQDILTACTERFIQFGT